MSLLNEGWWGSFVAGLRSTPLAEWPRRLGVSEEALIEALIEADPGGAAQDAPWWPEALRARADTPIRTIARRFDTTPRRLRRALARDGLRAGGIELHRRGDPALAPFRARLGEEPDAAIARAAGVAVEAVQGERRRLDIPPFRVAPEPIQLTADEQAWIRGPEPMRRVRQRPDAERLEVVRRPRPGSETGRTRAPEGAPGAPARVAPVVIAAPVVAAPVVAAPVEGAGSAGAPGRRVGRDFFHGREEREIDRLLQPAARPRDGRQRIVRTESPRTLPRLDDRQVPVRPVRLRALEEVERGSVRPARPAVPPTEPPRVPLAVVRTAPAAAAPPPVQAAPALVQAAPAPVQAVPALVPAAPAPLPIEAAPTPLALVWHVRIPGSEIPMVVEAADAWDAARVAAGRLPREVWSTVGLVLAEADEDLPAW